MMKIKNCVLIAGMCMLLIMPGCKDKNTEEEYMEAAALLEAHDYEAAAESFAELSNGSGMLAEVYRGLGLAEFYQGNYAEASIALSKSLLHLNTDNQEFEKDVKSYLALSRTRRMEYEEAIMIYDELIQEYVEADYYYLRGNCCMELGDYESAKVDFDHAAELSTDSAMFISIYEIFDEMQMNADGAAYLEKGLSLVDADDYYSKGLIYYYLQEYGNAKENLQKSLKSEKNKDAVLLLGKVYMEMEDISSARALYQEYVSDEQVAAEAYNGLALCDIQMEDYDSALKNVQKGLEIADQSAKKSLLFNELCIYEYLNDWPTAREKADAYLELYPGDEAAIREQQFLNH